MSKTWIGALLTAFYFSAVATWCIWQWPELAAADASKIGGFLGGVFSPVAFLWLVLGYFQQGQELRQNTRALELQAEELKHSVQHQAELVEVTRSQLQAEISRLEQEQERLTQAAKPKLRFLSGGASSSGSRIEARLIGQNVGNTAVDVTLAFEPTLQGFSPMRATTWTRGEQKHFTWAYSTSDVPESVLMTVNYVDAAGVPGVSRFRLTALSNAMSWDTEEIF
ncbi:hypothetical protein [Pseudoxanthomonas sp. Root65]|uniref:hypothetical protein n=1 Tax=Pseudoxanthomonas sp. Root65 TaxID=1736576 RepID=UPI000A5763A9|nr:hypothetical protein [Pseudoxanthomonas sp. Root65]